MLIFFPENTIDLMRDYVTLPKIHHQASFPQHFFRISLPSSCFHVAILFMFAALGIGS